MMMAVLIAVMVLMDAASDVLLARGMKQLGAPANLWPSALVRLSARAAVNFSCVMGILTAAVHFVCFLALLSLADLAFVIPAASLVYVVSTLGARFVLRESISPRRWAGIVLVCLGVAIVSTR